MCSGRACFEAATSGAQQPAPQPSPRHGDDERGDRLEPLEAKERAAERADEDGSGEVGAEQVLHLHGRVGSTSRAFALGSWLEPRSVHQRTPRGFDTVGCSLHDRMKNVGEAVGGAAPQA